MGNNEIDEDVMPVFLINGFLEAGKTQFLEFTMDQEYFQTEGKTLLIVCEEGDTEYDEKKLKTVLYEKKQLKDENQVAPTDARLKYENQTFTVLKEKPGHTLNKETVYEAVN